MKYLFMSCAIAFLSFSFAQTIVMNDDQQVDRFDCAIGGSVVVNGDYNKLSFSGSCQDVTLNGDYNVIIYDGLENILFNGDNNTVTWQSSSLEEPSTIFFGDDNSFFKADLSLMYDSIGVIAEETITEMKPADAESTDMESSEEEHTNPLAVALGEGGMTSFACENHDVSIVGSDLEIMLSGQCNTVVVVGSDNNVTAEGLVSLNVVGTDNTVVYSMDEEPEVILMGSDNSVTKQ